MAKVRNLLKSGLSDQDGSLIGLVCYQTAEGTVDVATSAAVQPLGVIVDLQDGCAIVAVDGEDAQVILSEDIEYTDCHTVAATTGGKVAIAAPDTGTITTAEFTGWSIGRVYIPYPVAGLAGSRQPIHINIQPILSKLS